MDWNWFFSALAQSSAAIVGFISAFSITKIISNQTVYNTKCRNMGNLLAKSHLLKEHADHRHFEWYNEQINLKQYEQVESDVWRLEVDELKPSIIYENYNFSPYEDKEEVFLYLEKIIKPILQSKTSEKDRITKDTLSSKESLDSSRSPIYGATIIRSPELLQMEANLESDINEEKERIESLRREVNYHIEQVKNFVDENDSNPESSSVITYFLILVTILFFIGVIYPLSFLPYHQNSILHLSLEAFIQSFFSFRGLLLTCVSLVFSAIRRNGNFRGLFC